METDDGSGGVFDTGDPAWWNWMLEVMDTIAWATRALAFGVVAAGGAIAAGLMLGNAETRIYGQVTLAGSGLFAAALMLSFFRSSPRR